MPSQLSDAKHSRERAVEMRSVAAGTNDIEAARAMYELADDYDQLAERARKRSASGPTPSSPKRTRVVDRLS